MAATTNGSTGANAIASFSSRAAADGRIKPDLALPGDYIVSARGKSSHRQQLQHDRRRRHQHGGAHRRRLQRPGAPVLHRWYPSGVKTPANAFTPSAALLKAVMINSCANMTGGNTARVGKEDAPAVGAGRWGRVLLDNALYFNAKADARKLSRGTSPAPTV